MVVVYGNTPTVPAVNTDELVYVSVNVRPPVTGLAPAGLIVTELKVKTIVPLPTETVGEVVPQGLLVTMVMVAPGVLLEIIPVIVAVPVEVWVYGSSPVSGEVVGEVALHDW